MISIVDYGLGNIRAFANIYKQLGIEYSIVSEVNSLTSATHLVLPGVGSFDWAMNRLNASGLRPVLDELVLERHVPVLGICVGMQMMACSSDEGSLSGLGWIPGKVRRFEESLFENSSISLPHMGWNDVIYADHALFADMISPRF